MPHLVLEYSANIIEKHAMDRLFRVCHETLAKELPTEINSCKSRALECSSYYVGSGEPGNAFIHAALKVLPGRTPEQLRHVGSKVMETLKSHFSESLQTLSLQITLEVVELPSTYFKVTQTQ